jgi:hypothetical protein
MHVQKDLIEMFLPTISGNNNKIAPVEQDPRTHQVDPCKSITLGPSSEIPDLLGNLLRAAKVREIKLNKKACTALKSSEPKSNQHWRL